MIISQNCNFYTGNMGTCDNLLLVFEGLQLFLDPNDALPRGLRRFPELFGLPAGHPGRCLLFLGGPGSKSQDILIK